MIAHDVRCGVYQLRSAKAPVISACEAMTAAAQAHYPDARLLPGMAEDNLERSAPPHPAPVVFTHRADEQPGPDGTSVLIGHGVRCCREAPAKA